MRYSLNQNIEKWNAQPFLMQIPILKLIHFKVICICKEQQIRKKISATHKTQFCAKLIPVFLFSQCLYERNFP